MSQQASGSWSELLSGRNGLRSLALAGGVALHAVNVYIVATVLPSVVADIGGLEYYAWNMTLFVVASIVGSAVTPKAINDAGLRRSFLVAIALFSVATAVCATAPFMGWMILGRTLQGFGGGMLLGLSYSSTRILFPERLWPRAMALLSSMWGVATFIGPAVGGIFAEAGAWRWAFWSVILVSAGLAVLVITQVGARDTERSSVPVRVPTGQLAWMVVAVLLVSVASLSDQLIWSILGVLAGALITVHIARIDYRSATPLMPKGAYRLGGHLGSLYACMALLSLVMTAEIFIPYFLQIIQGFSPLAAGYFMVLMSAGWSTGSIISSSRALPATNRFMQVGPVLTTVSLLGLAFVLPLYQPSDLLPLATGAGVLLFGVGLGIGVIWPHLLTQLFHDSPKGQENIASAAIITVQLYALALGAAIGGMVTNAAGLTEPGGLAGTQHAALALMLVLAVGPAVAAVLVRPVIRIRRARAASPATAMPS
ncbi:MFS transporter [Castellaniella sp.]|uniref:MFS transporter n=1 Tax=Castellaniella sp. TaxID=1955812 RepID=UPI00356086B8